MSTSAIVKSFLDGEKVGFAWCLLRGCFLLYDKAIEDDVFGDKLDLWDTP